MLSLDYYRKSKILICLLMLFSFNIKAQEDFQIKREEMIKTQIISRGIIDKQVIEAMRKVPRELFVPKKLRSLAYEDTPLPIGEEQTISQPYIVALMTSLLELNKSDRVLEIGTGSGYQAAVLAQIVKEVYTIEIIRSLAFSAQNLLYKLGYKNIKVKWGDGFEGWKEYAPFDEIIITCSIDEFPRSLIEQLKEGGKILAPINNDMGYQNLILGVKTMGKIIQKSIIPCRFVPATHKVR